MGAPAYYRTRARGNNLQHVTLSLGAIVLAGFAVALTHIVVVDGVGVSVGVMLLAMGSTWFATTSRTPLALAFLMIYLGGLDGYLKLSTGSSVITLVRDVLLYAIAAGALIRSQLQGRRLSLPPLTGWVIAYVCFVLVQIPNPTGGTLFHSLAGVKPHLEFVPLFFLGYITVRSVTRLRRFVLLLLVLAAANGIVAYVQFNLSPDQLAAWGPGYAQLVNGTGGFAGAGRVFTTSGGTSRVRPFGLGSEAGGGGVAGVLALGGLFALGSLVSRLRYRLLAALFGAGAVTAVITSQGRAVIIAAIATVLAYGVLTAMSQRRVASFVGLGVAAAISYVVISSIVSSAGSDAFRYQSLSASKILATASPTQGGARPAEFSSVVAEIRDYPLGAGLATAGPASGVAGGSALTDRVNAESEFNFLVLETGVPGLIVMVGFTLFLLGTGLVRCRREPDPEARLLLAAIVSPIAGILVDFSAGPDTVTAPAGPYLWCVAGVLAYWLFTRPSERTRRTPVAV